MSVFRVFVEKKKNFATASKGCYSDLQTSLQIKNLTGVRIVCRYDVESITKEDFQSVYHTVFSEPQVDNISDTMFETNQNDRVFATEYLPGQFDQRADSCAQCIQLATTKNKPIVASATIYILQGSVTDDEFEKIKKYLINPVEAREASFEKPKTLINDYIIPSTVKTIDGFLDLSKSELDDFIREYSLAMDSDDIVFCQDYFKNTEKRNPTITEIKMIDTYWSDHCRHTTFSTIITDAKFQCDYIQKSYEKYMAVREELYVKKKKPVSLMDLATIATKKLKKDGLLQSLDESEEINACSVKINVDVDGINQKWLLMFKNETHNHPTEIEPFGGAATCLGGAIRDPLSGRSYVYQAMRVTGAGDPLVPLDQTVPGKLPQKKITLGAASGYSSYGNQIGLATGIVNEIYHPGYVAKRMEVGAVIAATPEENVIRTVPNPGDQIILLGGKTGRDGCGGATGSSKSHTLESLQQCGAEVQKGNAPEERKIQRLFRNKNATTLIKRCNDFGAGGISVAIGELADGLIINLDKVTKKYEGLDGTELAISESQERMAVVVENQNVDLFLSLAHEENLEATVVAQVTSSPRLIMNWCGNEIVNLSRAFLDSNGASKSTDMMVAAPRLQDDFCVDSQSFEKKMQSIVGDLNCCSQKGLTERFDSTIGGNTVLMPLGGKFQMTPIQAMVAKIPVEKKSTTTCSVMGYGFDPYSSSKSPYHGAAYAVTESVAKIVAAGGSHESCWLSFQEYFERTNNDPLRWGKPLSALLGAFEAQLGLGVAAIGGKDSMSGTFESIDVPPTLISFAVSVSSSKNIISPEFKNPNSNVYYIAPKYNENNLPDFADVNIIFSQIESLIKSKKVTSVYTLGMGGIGEAVFKMTLGNKIGFEYNQSLSSSDIFKKCYGAFVVEAVDVIDDGLLIGKTSKDFALSYGDEIIKIDDLQQIWEEKLENIFPAYKSVPDMNIEKFQFSKRNIKITKNKVAVPKVLIPVFPGTNCEYDSAKAFKGAKTEIFVIKNLTSDDIKESADAFAKKIKEAQIIMLPGGFSGGDEPDGSAKFIVSFFQNPKIKQAVQNHLQHNDGLMLGICNGFQALIKLGLVPFGNITEPTDESPTLTFNAIGRHQSKIVQTRICSVNSPWLAGANVGDIHSVAISHGEGRFIASDALIATLAKNGQIATQYVDFQGNPTMDSAFNPNASVCAIEGITSPDGRIFGKMGHSERSGEDIFKNISGDTDQKIFQSGINYFK